MAGIGLGIFLRSVQLLERFKTTLNNLKQYYCIKTKEESPIIQKISKLLMFNS